MKAPPLRFSFRWARRWQSVFATGSVIGMLLLQPVSAAEEIPGLEVKAAILTSGVDKEKNFIEPGFPSGISLKHGPVFFWTVLSGTDETLSILKGRFPRSLPIQHKWTFIGRGGKSHDRPDVNERDVEEISVGTIHRWPALTLEALAGAFDWRTWSGKRHLRPGNYEIRVLSANGQIMHYKGKECVYSFDFFP